MNTRNEPLINLINYLRLICRQHKQVKSFAIGEAYEENNFDNFQFPLVWLELPIISSFTDLYNPNKLSVTFTINCLTNLVNDSNGNLRQVTESMISKSTNQLDYSDLALQDQLMNNAYAIIAQLSTRIARDASDNEVNILIDGLSHNLTMTLDSINIENESRVTNKDLYKSSATITLIIENSYYCPLNSYFDYDVQ
jgi:hypothetical protein